MKWTMLVLLAVTLACGSRAPEYVLRGWTPTAPATAMLTASSTPAVIYVLPLQDLRPTTAVYSAAVRVDHLEIRNGPGTRYPANPDLYLSSGDELTIMACKYDAAGEAWVNFYWPKRKLAGWAAVTWHGSIFLWPMPESCTR